MTETVKRLIETLKQSVPFVELRANSTDRYLEAVLLNAHVAGCCETLRQTLGSPVKDFGERVRFERELKQAVERLGGIQIDQCLFFTTGDQGQVAYAMLWPWASDQSRVTLKLGLL